MDLPLFFHKIDNCCDMDRYFFQRKSGQQTTQEEHRLLQIIGRKGCGAAVTFGIRKNLPLKSAHGEGRTQSEQWIYPGGNQTRYDNKEVFNQKVQSKGRYAVDKLANIYYT